MRLCIPPLVIILFYIFAMACLYLSISIYIFWSMTRIAPSEYWLWSSERQLRIKATNWLIIYYRSIEYYFICLAKLTYSISRPLVLIFENNSNIDYHLTIIIKLQRLTNKLHIKIEIKLTAFTTSLSFLLTSPCLGGVASVSYSPLKN